MRPGDLVSLWRYDKNYVAVYLGPSWGNMWQFLFDDGAVRDVDLSNKLVYYYEVHSDAR
jgi:hypothetical protein